MVRICCFTVSLLALGLLASGARLQAAVTPSSAEPTEALATLALVGAKIFPAPDEPPIERGVVVITGSTISAVGAAETTTVPTGAQIIDATGLSLLAGFWNCHVHFTEGHWWDAGNRPAIALTEQLQRMLTRYGFTTVVDLASELSNTANLRSRIESGELPGPRILTAGSALYPVEGVPYYVTDALPELATLLPTPVTGDQAAGVVQQNVEGGADLTKLFLVTGVRAADGSIELRTMSPEVARAAVRRSHEHGRLVFAHPSTLAGLNLAIESDVDVLAHTIQDTENWTPAVIETLRAADMALVPTLALFSRADDFAAVQYQVKSYVAAGGDVLFGTDVGFLTDYHAVSREFQLMLDAGLTFPELLATLTTNPARRFGLSVQTGRIKPGLDADLVLVAGDPVQDPSTLLRVRYTIRGGRIIFARK